MRIAITGRTGQVAQSLIERASAAGIEIVTLARPQVDLAEPENIEAALSERRLDVVVSAAAYTAVDLAESEPELARQINVNGAAAVARAAASLGLPVIHLSTDYVFNGSLDRPYRESDRANPLGVYGQTKLDGEQAVALSNARHAILRTSWIYSPFGKNFVRTMLSLAGSRAEISVVDDQLGNPTSALDIADGVLRVAQNLAAAPDAASLHGIFHMTAAGDTTWAGFAKDIFSISALHGGPFARVIPIPTSGYPTPAQRPANSRLDSSRLRDAHGVQLPHWQLSLPKCIERIVAADFIKKGIS